MGEDSDKSCGHRFRLGEKCQVKIRQLHPTQGAVGKEEVRRKIEELQRESANDLQDYRKKKRVPVVVGPGQKLYMIDHHHSTLALLGLGVDSAYIEVVGDLSESNSMEEFWAAMRLKNWAYPFNAQGEEISPIEIPADLKKLEDDPYRSVAGIVSDLGGFPKLGLPFEEFVWAQRFRILKLLAGPRPADFDSAAFQALALIRWGFWSKPAECAEHLRRLAELIDPL
jgi:hypothetical protein